MFLDTCLRRYDKKAIIAEEAGFGNSKQFVVFITVYSPAHGQDCFASLAMTRGGYWAAGFNVAIWILVAALWATAARAFWA